MTQQNVYNLLKKKDEWMTAKEIAEILEVSRGSVTTCLNKLLKREEVLKKVLGRGNPTRRPGFKSFYWRAK